MNDRTYYGAYGNVSLCVEEEFEFVKHDLETEMYRKTTYLVIRGAPEFPGGLGKIIKKQRFTGDADQMIEELDEIIRKEVFKYVRNLEVKH